MKPARYGPFPYSPIIDRPKLTWPGGARVALWVIPNIEFFPLDEPIPPFGPETVPDVSNWSTRDYGARIGVFRLMDVLGRHKLRGTVTLNSEVCEAYPPIIEECMKLDWEIMGHNQSNSRVLMGIPPDEEQALIKDVFATIEKSTGKRPRGWLGSGLKETWHTLDYLLDEGCEYIADWVNDDQPYRMDVNGRQMVSIPYSTEINDLPAFYRYFRSADEFEQMICRQFDTLYAEGEEQGRVMAICLHPFVIGMPHRISCLDRALDYICGHEHVWLATGSEIIDHYLSSVD
jgi:peptidoglycan/xylan/chitin deacetylase (PgdA/CDA1 family)